MSNKKILLSLYIPLLFEQVSIVSLTTLHAITISNSDLSFLSAVSLVDQINIFVSSIFICIATGTAILTAHAFSADNKEYVGTLSKTSMLFGCAISVLLSFMFLLFNQQILTLIYPDIDSALYSYSSVYLQFTALSFPFFFVFTNVLGIMRSSLNVKSPLIVSLVSGIINFVVTYLLVFKFNLGILGIGIGLLCSRALSSLLAILIWIKKGKSSVPASSVNLECFRNILRLSVFIGIETILFQFGKLLLQRFLTTAGRVQVDSNAVANSIMTLLILPGTAMTCIVQNLCGYYVGQGEPLKAKRFIWKSVLYNSILFLAVSLFILPVLKPIIGLYTSDPQTAATAYTIMLIFIISLPIAWSIGNASLSGLKGMGEVRIPTITVSISMWIYRIPLSYYFGVVKGYGAAAIWLIMCIEWAIYGIVFILYSYITKNNEHKKVGTI